MADQTGTNGNDLLFFSGTTGQLNTTFTNPYCENLGVDDEYNINDSSYEGLPVLIHC